MRPILLALTLALAPSCVTADWSRDSRSSPPPQEATDVLVEGRSTLHDALALLGAPLHVYEYKQLGAALAYGWYAGSTKGLNVSVPVYESASASFDYATSEEGLRGLLLLFDSQLRLERVREGWLADLTSGFAKQPPTVIEEETDPSVEVEPNKEP